MQPAIRFHRDECIDLPPCMYETRDAALTEQQKKAYKDVMHKLYAEVESGQITAANEAVKAQKLLQIACGAAYSESGDVLSLDATPRMEVVLEVVEQSVSKIIVFVPFRGAIEPLRRFLEKRIWHGSHIWGREQDGTR